MTDDRINEEQVEKDMEMLGRIRNLAWQRNPRNLAALIERLQVKILIEDLSRRQKNVYRAIIDYFEDVLDERLEKGEGPDRSEVRRSAVSYVRDLIRSLDD